MVSVASSIEERRENPPPGTLFHSGHTWVRLISDDLAFVGATDFAVNFVGGLAGVSLPGEFCPLRKEETAWALTSEKGRRLHQVAPIGGWILAVNSALLENVNGLERSPYNLGWLLCLQSATIPHQMGNLLSHEPDRLWSDRTCSSMRTVLGSALRLPFRDDSWRPSFGDDFSDEEWEALRRRLFPAPHAHLLPRESERSGRTNPVSTLGGSRCPVWMSGRGFHFEQVLYPLYPRRTPRHLASHFSVLGRGNGAT